MLSIISSILLAFGASASFFGSASYVALFFQLIINIFFISNSKKVAANLFFILIYFIILVLAFVIFDSEKEFDLSIVNIILQISVFVTLERSNYMFNIVRRSLFIQLVMSILVCVYGLIVQDYSMFVNAANTKGMGDFLIPKGVYSTPQALASVAVATLLFYHYKLVKSIAFTTLLASFNRTMLLVYLSSIFVKYYKLALSFFVVLLFFSFFYVSDLSSITNIGTVLSRINLFEGALLEINTGSIRQWVFGTLNTVQFHLPMYNVDKDYIESAYLFIFKYFGLLGCILYFFWGLRFTFLMIKRKDLIMCSFFFLYFFFAQLMTHEFLVSSFYQIMFLAVTFNFKRDIMYAPK